MIQPALCLVCGKPLDLSLAWQPYCTDCLLNRPGFCERLNRDTGLDLAMKTLARYGQPVPDQSYPRDIFAQAVTAYRLNPLLNTMVVAVKGDGLTHGQMGAVATDVMLDAIALYQGAARATDHYKKAHYNDTLRHVVNQMFGVRSQSVGIVIFNKMREEGYKYLWT